MSRAPANLFGEIRLEDGRWRIECEPHVRAKLRRLFPQVDQRASDLIWLSDNAENCRDLLWFTDRYPMKVTPLKRLKAQSADHVEAESLVHQLLNNFRPPDPFELALPARVYQAAAASLACIKSGLLVADDVGLGKTVTGICPMAMPKYLPALVVTLSHLPPQWVGELEKFAPSLKVHVLKSGKPYDLLEKPKRRRGAAEQSSLFGEEPPRLPDFIVCNYHKLAGWAETLAGFIKFVVYDEVQELRVSDSQKYAAANLIARKALLRMGLSATPIYNYGAEFFNIVDVLLPGALGTREEFVREWCSDDRIKDPKAFGLHLAREGIMLRRTRKDVGRELPPCQTIPHTIQSDRAALDKISSTAAELARVILADRQQYQGQKFRASEEFNGLLRQATGIAKAPYVAEFVRMVLSSEEKVIVFAWHREVYALLMNALAEFNPVMYTGSESPRQKTEAKEAFINGNARVMLMSLRAGAGTDGLQHVCKVGIFAELDWSPGVHVQCIGRFHRDEQPEASMAYFLLAEDGSDPVIADIVGIKKAQLEGVRDPEAALIEELEVDSGGVKRLAAAYLSKLAGPADSGKRDEQLAEFEEWFA